MSVNLELIRICGYGRIGRVLARFLIERYIDVVVIERSQNFPVYEYPKCWGWLDRHTVIPSLR